MSDSNFTPLSSKKSSVQKKHSSFKIVGFISSLILVFGVLAGFIMVQSGFNFSPRAASANKNLTQYGWNGTCFTKLQGIVLASRYQCPGKISNWGAGCQGAQYKTASWSGASLRNGSARVCITNGSEGKKDANGCFTQQLDLGDNVDRFPPPGFGPEDYGPEGFFSYDSCGGVVSTPTNPKPENPKPEEPVPTLPPVLPTPVQPGSTTVTAACVGTTGTQATLQWTNVPEAQQYAYRLNYRDNDRPDCPYGWYCAEPPDALVEAEDNFVNTQVTLTVVPGHTYDFWVHAVQEGVGGPSALTSFTCSAEAPSPTPDTPTPTTPPDVPTPTTVQSCPVPQSPTNVRVSCPTCTRIGGTGGSSSPTQEPTSSVSPTQSQEEVLDEQSLSPTTQVSPTVSQQDLINQGLSPTVAAQ